MIRVFLILILWVVCSFSAVKNLEGVYKIEYGIFGKLGQADAKISVDKNNDYEIKAKAYATGLARVLSGNLVEDYISRGKYVDNSYRPDYFKKVRKKRENLLIVEFFFDHKNKKIIKKEYKKEKKRKPITDISHIEYEFVESKKEEVLPFWTKEDILSLFFNVKHYIDGLSKGSTKIVSAVGASDKREGKIDIIIPDQIRYNKINEYLEKNGEILIVKIYKKIFASKQGEFFISLDNEGLCDKSVLKDVLFFGDITATLERKSSI